MERREVSKLPLTADDLAVEMRVTRFLTIVGAGIVLTPAFVIVLFESLIVVGVVSDDGPRESLFLTALVFGAGLYAGLIALRTSVRTGVVVFPLVAGLAVGGILLWVSATTLRWHSCPAVGAATPGCPGGPYINAPGP
jgi:hypothetical protein